jgi:hypothetical protein
MSLWGISARSAAAGILVASMAAVVVAHADDALPTQSGLAANGRTTISGSFQNSEIVIGVSARVAGAIDSLTWKGREFINAYDHGRELQSAAQFDGWIECFNPTEAGSRDDRRGPASSSQLISLETKPGRITTRTRMAFWLAPGATSPNCPGSRAVNQQMLSDIELFKTVTLGAHRLANVIEHDVTFRVPAEYKSATFEALTGYMPPSFSKFWTYDPKNDQLAELTDGPGEQRLPLIMATPEGDYAMGVYSPASSPMARYGRFRFDRLEGPDNAAVKWNCVFRTKPAKAGDYRYVIYSIVGSLQDVRAAMAKLAALPNRRTP